MKNLIGTIQSEKKSCKSKQNDHKCFYKTKHNIAKCGQHRVKYLANETLSQHTSIKIGGKCKVFVLPKNYAELRQCVKCAQKNGVKFCVLGNGTNTLFGDGYFDGVVICTKDMNAYKVFIDGIFAMSGLGLFELCDICKKNALAGLEFCKGIPGSVGGAMQTNAGAFGGCVGDFVDYVQVYDTQKDKFEKLNRQQLGFAYRTSLLENSNKIVCGVKFALHKGDAHQIEKLQNEFFQKKLASQPYDELSLGSTFKRNPNFPPVSKIIDELGLKGFCIGGASVSQKHAGFVINKSKATCKDYLLLIKYIQDKIFKAYGFVPELEIKHKE